jgi:hypothetical protein
MNLSAPAAQTLLVRLSGDWKISEPLPSAVDTENSFEPAKGIRRIAFDIKDLCEWDSRLLTFLIKIFKPSFTRK